MDELKGRLIFHNSMDVWITLCREKGWDRRNYDRYAQFVAYLKENGVALTRAPQGHPMKDRDGKPIENYTIRLSGATIEKLRSFS